MAKLQQLAGEKRKHEAQPAVGALSKPGPLSDIGNNASILNAANADALKEVLANPGTDAMATLKSDADEQLLIGLTLPQLYKLHAIKLSGPDDGSAPASIKLFINRTAMSFDDCEDFPATQSLTLTSASATLPLQQTKFSNVSSLTVFIENNQADKEVTCLSRLELVGVPVHTTNMNDLKKGG